MEAPKCKLCNARHYGICQPARAPEPEPKPPENPTPKPAFDRTAYQREYMRKRRAAKRQSLA